MADLIERRAVIDALHTWFRDGFDEDKWWNSTHVLAAIEGLPSAQQRDKWETCFECPLSHGCPKIKGCTNEQAIEYASQIPNDCPLSTQPDHIADSGKKVSISCGRENDLISRQAAIDAIMGQTPEPHYPSWYAAQIEKIPAVQPDHNADVSKKVFISCAHENNDVIFRKMAIEAIEKAKMAQTPDGEIFVAKYNAEMNIQLLPSAQPEPHWIPCSERLPENDNEVLITVWDAEDDYVEVYKGFYQGHEWWTQWCHGCSKIKDEPCGANIVTAWMPLPEPWKEGEA